MISQEKLRQLVERLLTKSRANQVNWRPENGFGKTTSFVLELPRSRVVVEYVSPTTQADLIRVRVANKDGNAVAEWSADEDAADWPLAQSLFTEANRVVLHGDEILKEVETAIESMDVIGEEFIPS